MSKLGAAVLRAINPLFPAPVHPFNLRNDSDMTYADWQYERGAQTIRFYLQSDSAEAMFRGKRVLDVGCGEGGKSVYYASLGASAVVGVDIIPEYARRAQQFAEKHGYSDRFTFLLADATHLPLDSGSFDTIIMNDFMEHVSDPKSAITEALRLCRPGGRIYINFPPYYHPFGAHLSDAIHVPWVHAFFSEDSMIRVYQALVQPLPDGEDRIRFRFSTDENGQVYLSYINKMTIARFDAILETLEITPVFYQLTPLRPAFSALAKNRLFQEALNKMVTCIIEKPAKE